MRAGVLRGYLQLTLRHIKNEWINGQMDQYVIKQVQWKVNGRI